MQLGERMTCKGSCVLAFDRQQLLGSNRAMHHCNGGSMNTSIELSSGIWLMRSQQYRDCSTTLHKVGQLGIGGVLALTCSSGLGW